MGATVRRTPPFQSRALTPTPRGAPPPPPETSGRVPGGRAVGWWPVLHPQPLTAGGTLACQTPSKPRSQSLLPCLASRATKAISSSHLAATSNKRKKRTGEVSRCEKGGGGGARAQSRGLDGRPAPAGAWTRRPAPGLPWVSRSSTSPPPSLGGDGDLRPRNVRLGSSTVPKPAPRGAGPSENVRRTHPQPRGAGVLSTDPCLGFKVTSPASTRTRGSTGWMRCQRHPGGSKGRRAARPRCRVPPPAWAGLLQGEQAASVGPGAGPSELPRSQGPGLPGAVGNVPPAKPNLHSDGSVGAVGVDEVAGGQRRKAELRQERRVGTQRPPHRDGLVRDQV